MGRALKGFFMTEQAVQIPIRSTFIQRDVVARSVAELGGAG
jgi:hypothetical protein